MLNGYFFVYINSFKTTIWNTSHNALPQQSSLVKDSRKLQMIGNNIFNHLVKPWSLIFTQMRSEKVGG